MRKDGGPAFPAPQFSVHESVDQEKIIQLGQLQGMTLRDYFAAKAMQGIIIHYKEGIRPQDCVVMAEDAYFVADAMIKARES